MTRLSELELGELGDLAGVDGRVERPDVGAGVVIEAQTLGGTVELGERRVADGGTLFDHVGPDVVPAVGGVARAMGAGRKGDVEHGVRPARGQECVGTIDGGGDGVERRRRRRGGHGHHQGCRRQGDGRRSGQGDPDRSGQGEPAFLFSRSSSRTLGLLVGRRGQSEPARWRFIGAGSTAGCGGSLRFADGWRIGWTGIGPPTARGAGSVGRQVPALPAPVVEGRSRPAPTPSPRHVCH